jgi:hypothetical protein
VSLRTRCVAAAAQPRWDEELVFSHVVEDGPHRPRVRFDIFQHGALADSRLMYTDLDLAKSAPPPSQAQQKQAAANPKAGGLAGSTTAYTLYLPLQADPGLLLSAAAVGAAAGEAAAAGGSGDAPAGANRRRGSWIAGRAAARAGSMRGLPGATLVGQELEVVVWWSKQEIMTNAGGTWQLLWQRHTCVSKATPARPWQHCLPVLHAFLGCFPNPSFARPTECWVPQCTCIASACRQRQSGCFMCKHAVPMWEVSSYD